jgi:hypothetical protein
MALGVKYYVVNKLNLQKKIVRKADDWIYILPSAHPTSTRFFGMKGMENLPFKPPILSNQGVLGYTSDYLL